MSQASPGARIPAPVRLVLASASPARLETLRRAGLDPEVIVSGVDEDRFDEPTIAELVKTLALAKAMAVAETLTGEALVLGCDSMLEFDGERFGKPASIEDARARWRRMRGGVGILYTGMALWDVAQEAIELSSTGTIVHFADVSDAEIELYLATGEPLGVAGAFTIDGLGGWFVQHIDGDHHNVVGLSLPMLRQLLARLGHGLADVGYPSA